MTSLADQARAAQQRRQRYQQLRSTVTPQQAQQMASLARENPSLSAGALFAAGSGGVQPGTPASRALGEGDRQVKAEQGGIKGLFGKAYRGAKAVGSALLPDEVGQTVNAVAPGIKGATRGLTGILAAPGEAIQATFRDSVADGDIRGSEWIDWVPRAFGNLGKTSAGQLVDQIGERGLSGLDTGNGFFLGGEVTKDQRRIAYKQANMQINGKGRAVTLGRYFANNIGLEPGNRAFNIVSGLADASLMLGSDPTSFVAAPTKGLQARRLFAGDASKGFDAEQVAAGIDSRLPKPAPVSRWVDVEPEPAAAVPGTFKRATSATPEPAWEGGPPLFHGTSREFPDGKLAASRSADSGADNLFGFGFYTTDAEDVASTYTKKGKGGARQLYSLRWNGDAPPRFLDLQEPVSPTLRNYLQNSTVMTDDFDTTVESFDALKAVLSSDASSGVDVMNAFRTVVSDADISKSYADELYGDLADFLESEGFDGLKHLGGAATGNKEHGVHIFFNNEKLTTASRLEEQSADFLGMPSRLERVEEVAADMGAVRGIRDTVNSDRVLEWLTTKKEGQQLVSYLAKETDFAKVYDATKGKVDPRLILEMTKREMTGDEIIEMLGPALGRTARTEKKFGLDAVAKTDLGVGGLGTVATAKFKQRVRDTRIFGTVPERVLPKNDLGETLKNADAFMRNARIDPAERSAIFTKFAEADGGAGMYDATRQMMVLGMERAVAEGIPRDRARALFQIYEDSSSGRRKFWQEQIGKEGEKAWVNKAFNATDELNGDGTTRALPHLASQFLDNNIPLPDPREIRAEISRYKNLLSLPGVQPGKMALEKISDNIFKPGVLLRPAYIARNQIDEQFRPAGVGLDSLFSHPVSYLQWVMTDQANVGKFLNKASGGTFKSRGATFGPDGQFFDENAVKIREAEKALKDAKATGDQAVFDAARKDLKAAREAVQSVTPFTDGVSEYVRSVTGGLGNWRNRSFAQANGDDLYQRSDAAFSRAMGEGVHRIFNDPIAKQIAAGVDIDDIKGQFLNGNLKKFREDLAKQGDRMAYLNDPIGADQYIDDTVEFVKTFVGDSVELRQAAATGRINGKKLTDGDTLTISKEALDELDALKQLDGFQGPDAVIGSTIIRGGGDDSGNWSKAVDFMFYQLADRPTRYLTKSPVFRQRYYKRMENLIGFMEPKAAADLIESARVANLKGKDIKRLQDRVKPGGTMTFDEADLVGKTDALEFTSNLLYDLHNRSQFFDVTRLLFPFGEAFKDSAVRYTQIVANNPVLPYRLGQIITGGRDADLNGDGEGFFYTDEQTGEEMFAFPGSDALLDAVGLEGAGKMRAPLKNLNILGTTVIPGFGPAVQIAAASMLPDEPDFNAVRALVSPYGDRTLDGGALESFLPSWFAKWRTAELVPFLDANPKQQKAFANAQKDMMGYLASTGEYDLQTPEGIQALQDDAKSKARSLFFIRGMAQSIAPSPPSPEFVAYDKDGTLQTQFKLAEEYRKIQEEQTELGTPEATNRVFIETFGEGAVLAVIPNTKQAQDQSPVPPTRKAYEYYQANKGAAERFPTVFGLFAPDDEGADFDFVAYQQQLDSGQREVITPDEAVRRANQRVARMIYDNAKAQAGDKPTSVQKQALGDLKALLAEDYPGYSSSFSNDTPKLLEDLKRAVNDPTLSKTPAGQGLAVWLKARDAAEAGAQAQFGVSWKQADRSRPIRDAMRALAEKLGQDFPGFTNIYERALEREMTRD